MKYIALRCQLQATEEEEEEEERANAAPVCSHCHISGGLRYIVPFLLGYPFSLPPWSCIYYQQERVCVRSDDVRGARTRWAGTIPVPSQDLVYKQPALLEHEIRRDCMVPHRGERLRSLRWLYVARLLQREWSPDTNGKRQTRLKRFSSVENDCWYGAPQNCFWWHICSPLFQLLRGPICGLSIGKKSIGKLKCSVRAGGLSDLPDKTWKIG